MEEWQILRISHGDSKWLNRDLSDGEVFASINEMGHMKTPDYDMLLPCFFHMYWHVVGEKVIRAVRNIFLYGSLLNHLNESVICLIPKGDSPSQLNQFRYISLCNALLKVVPKTLATS